jgi:hypothetical protein
MLPTFNDIKGLGFSFRGRPFCIGTKTRDLRGLDVVFRGVPFAGALIEETDRMVTAAPGTVALTGQIATCAWIVSPTAGSVTARGDCSYAGTIYVDTGIETPAGAIAIGGSIAGIAGWLALYPEPGRVTTAGAGSVFTARVLTPEPGTVKTAGSITTATVLAILTGAQRRYECKLTADGQIPVVIPMAGFTSRQRAGEPSYSEVSIPGLDCLGQIMNRSTGSFTVSMLLVINGIALQREVLFESPIDRMTITGNDRRQNIVLSGNRPAIPNTGQQVIPLSGVTYRGFANGMTTLRTATPDIYLKPGDTVTYRDDGFVARSITYSFSSTGSFMEVREAEG